MKYLNEIALSMTKVYQYWHHRRLIVQKYGKLPADEYDALENVYIEDDKNYHMWTYRMWLTEFAGTWEQEFKDVVKKIEENPKNNSVWSYRYYIVFHNADYVKVAKTEAEFAKTYIVKDLDNESAWVYYKGILLFSPKKTFGDKAAALELAEKLKGEAIGFCQAIRNADEPNRFARGMLVDLLKDKKETVVEAKKMCDELVEVDKIRKNYWLWVKDGIENKTGIEKQLEETKIQSLQQCDALTTDTIAHTDQKKRESCVYYRQEIIIKQKQMVSKENARMVGILTSLMATVKSSVPITAR
eukprot:TRINITY_DN87976_c0_g1_i1.p6 TRINITY_DN87976_c0_g1~~TRINITY_DN87976_c0_g1_i1.p6  ORF type:complete len:300 (-),score=53.16 TRINITY_DN87976_c0_g1_i1:6072-6971(-)